MTFSDIGENEFYIRPISDGFHMKYNGVNFDTFLNAKTIKKIK